MRSWLLFVLAAAGAAPAHADLTATYVAVNPEMDFTMKVEVAANGDLRADSDMPGVYLVKHGGSTYFVFPDQGGPAVIDLEDAVTLLEEELSRIDPDFCEGAAQAGSALTLRPRGTVTVGGRIGEAYATAGRPASRPDVVISRDPSLAPIGAAMAAQYRVSMTLMRQCPSAVPMFTQMQELLDSGAPLQIGPMRLDRIDTAAIDPARFLLPAAPATREEARALMTRNRLSPVGIEVQPPH
ncbi:MAG TPA: hypothetical protein VGX37_00855 [Allosphingosinicella sp.]|jgi:hypothetical protein|nr:hypothetical protein [Allosphingosinicella sp.]